MKIFTLKRMATLLVLTTLIALTNFEANAKPISEHSGLALVNENKDVLHAEVSDVAINLGAAITAVTAPDATPATSVGSTSFQANWNEVKGVDGYLLNVYTKVGRLLIKTYIENYNPKPVPGAKINSFNVNGLNMNTTYYYTVKAVIGMEASPLSNEISLTTLLTAPEPPVATAASNITTNSFQANWETVTGATGYEVTLLNDDGQNYVQIDGDIDGGDVTSLNITGLNSETQYSYYVKAVNDQGMSAYSNRISVITFGIPVAPVATAASNITTTSFQANWEVVPGATGYLLTVGNDFEQDYVQVDGAITGGDITNFEVTGLDPDIPYSYLVKAVNEQGISGNSNMISLRTLTYKSLILSANPAEGGIVSGDGTFDQSTAVIATATVNRGYVFENWTENGIEVSTEPSYTFTLNTNRTLVANFQLTTGVDDNFRSHIKVWPNSISTLMHISEIPIGSTIQITSLLGQLEFQKTDCNSIETLNLASLKNGIYILTLKNKKGSYTQKIIKR